MPDVHDRSAVLEALDQLPPASWFLVLKMTRGLVDGIARILVEDPAPEVTVREAIDEQLARLEPPTEDRSHG